MDTYIVFWLAATVVFVLVELMTVGLTSIWFAAGSFVAFIIALLGGNVVVQGIAFILVSVVLLALTKPWAGKYINSRTVKTNVDSLVGERAVLTEDADSMKQTGKRRCKRSGVDSQTAGRDPGHKKMASLSR